ncbi:MAG: HAD-IC family P-type ATPase [Candidatus Thermoplasmatota archaeon]|nr:HAD-IC family P-type ATPase [Euryarchaeota archaeon]MBU4032337.1 HAD-IC family P-type ATPase [Candidatus Thermoplasmatota archaeon]MBU4071759.1 HAD-IC family P-type ATPase [Candidatus Thermoplasmatota archaeon]MBU4144919.1 HAD-IC family P-type ATPase [Candidatus Thermoplasmatota archaeon]MBU4592525.1 HAD-IC family P-type ATPase [Candidatus Thermoplasmatota archaeon]
MERDASKSPEWHGTTADEVMRLLGTGALGLSTEEVESRRARYGYNELGGEKRSGIFKAIYRQINQLLIYILLLAAIITAALGHLIDTAVILAVVLANVIIGLAQELKADKAIEALDKLVVSDCTVVRDGQRITIPSKELVVGDMVFFESGNKIPADVRLIYVKGMKVDEALLTGESVPVDKTVESLNCPAASPAEKTNMVFAGTLVTYGRGRGVVVATSNNTEVSRISACMREAEEIETPLQKRLSAFSIYLSGAVAILAIITFVGGLLAGQDMVFIFLASVSIAVAVIPEGLPALVTIALAIGVRGMASRNAILRNLPSVETLGSTTVICSDKTGTLTMNQMTVSNIFTGDAEFIITGSGYKKSGEFFHNGQQISPQLIPALSRTLVAGAICNDASLKHDGGIVGDPTEVALLVSAAKAGLETHLERLDEIPFESEIQYMATMNIDASRRVIYLKGMPEKIVAMCDSAMARDGSRQEIDGKLILAKAEEMASNALRVIAIAEKEVPGDVKNLENMEIGGFVFLGIQGMNDPPRPEVIEAVKQCQDARIKIVMITGDHRTTAEAIALKLGITEPGSKIITGSQLEIMTDQELYDIVPNCSVYARASPIHKYRIVQQLRKHGEVVAVTGDGVNDAPALKAADIGIAMGMAGTDVTKEAADMILTDDNFATIVSAVEEGRHTYSNLQKMLAFIIPTNIGQALAVTIAILAMLPLPLMPVHILWVNLVTSVTCTIPLALEGKEPGLLRKPPRSPKAPLLGKRIIVRLIIVAATMTIGSFIAFNYAIQVGYSVEAARTLVMTTIVLMELVCIFSTRSFVTPAISKNFFSNRWVFVGVGFTLFLQGCVVYLPVMNRLFNTVPIAPLAWLPIILIALALFLMVESEKVIMKHYAAGGGEP